MFTIGVNKVYVFIILTRCFLGHVVYIFKAFSLYHTTAS